MKWLPIAVLILNLVAAKAVMADDKAVSAESKKESEPKSAKGIQFSVPADWPIEKRNGALGPIPIEEYLALKFKKLEDRIVILENKVNNQSSEDSKKSSANNTNRFQSYKQKPAPVLGEDQSHEQAS